MASFWDAFWRHHGKMKNMTDTELLDLLESGKVDCRDFKRGTNGKFYFWSWQDIAHIKKQYFEANSIRDCIRKLAEQQEKK